MLKGEARLSAARGASRPALHCHCVPVVTCYKPRHALCWLLPPGGRQGSQRPRHCTRDALEEQQAGSLERGPCRGQHGGTRVPLGRARPGPCCGGRTLAL